MKNFFVIYSFTLHLVPSNYRPRNIQLNVESSTSINVSWKAPILENALRITGYQVCVTHALSKEDCDVIIRTEFPACVAKGLKTASKYRIRVSAKNIVGYGEYSQDYNTITNGPPPEIITSEIKENSFVVKFQPPREEIWYCQIILITLQSNGSLPKLSEYLENYNSYHEAKASAQSSYIAAEFNIKDFKKFQEFTVGDGSTSSGVVGMSKYGPAVRKYFNGPLSPDTLYTVFQRFYTEQKLVYVSDFLSLTKTKKKENFDQFSKPQAETKSFQEDGFKLPFILIVVFLLLLLLVLGVIVIYKRRMPQDNAPNPVNEISGQITGSCTITHMEHRNEQENRPTVV